MKARIAETGDDEGAGALPFHGRDNETGHLGDVAVRLDPRRSVVERDAIDDRSTGKAQSLEGF